MEFKSIYEAKSYFRKYQKFDNSNWNSEKDGYWLGIDNKPTFGDYILFKHIKEGKTISSPILAVCVGHNIWDQALVLEFVERNRAYMYNGKHTIRHVYTDYQGKQSIINNRLFEYDIKTEQIQFWTDDIILLGKWNHKPTFSELKKALQ